MMNLFKKFKLLPEPPERTARFELIFPESYIEVLNQLCIDCDVESPAQVVNMGLGLLKKFVDADKNNKEFVIVNKNTEDSSTLIFSMQGKSKKELMSLASKLDKTESEVIRDALNYYSNALKEYEDEHNL